MMRTIFVFYAAGTLATVADTALGWFLSSAGVFTILGSTLAPSFSLPNLYQRLVWGGAWALVYPALRLSKLPWIHASLLLALFPTALQLLYLFPKAGVGWFGLDKGFVTPFAVLGLNIVWALLTVLLGNRAAR